jgi:hypothetical protein
MRELCGQFVKPERREQADDRPRDPLGNLSQGMLRGRSVVTGGVESAPLPFDEAFFQESVEPVSRDSTLLQVARPDHAEAPHNLECLALGW